MSELRKFSNMDSVKVNRNELLSALKINKEEHRKTFLDAQEGYREDVIDELDRMLKDAREGKKIKRALVLPEPKDHTSSYETAIRMLEMCVDDIIEITDHEFQQLVMDNWNWKADFVGTASNYTNRSR